MTIGHAHRDACEGLLRFAHPTQLFAQAGVYPPTEEINQKEQIPIKTEQGASAPCPSKRERSY